MDSICGRVINALMNHQYTLATIGYKVSFLWLIILDVKRSSWFCYFVPRLIYVCQLKKTALSAFLKTCIFGECQIKKNVSTIHTCKISNVVPVHTMKAYRGGKVVPLIPNLSVDGGE